MDATPSKTCMEPDCHRAVTVQLAATRPDGSGYCWEHRQKAYDYNRGMA